MGAIRKTLRAGTLGMVNDQSKKQRMAMMTMKSAAMTAEITANASQREEQRLAMEHQFKYETDPVYREWTDAQRAAAEAARQAQIEQMRADLAAKKAAQAEKIAQSLARLRLVFVTYPAIAARWSWKMARVCYVKLARR